MPELKRRIKELERELRAARLAREAVEDQRDKLVAALRKAREHMEAAFDVFEGIGRTGSAELMKAGMDGLDAALAGGGEKDGG